MLFSTHQNAKQLPPANVRTVPTLSLFLSFIILNYSLLKVQTTVQQQQMKCTMSGRNNATTSNSVHTRITKQNKSTLG